MKESHAVLILDMSHPFDPSHEYRIEGFTDLSHANEFARRWVRDSVESLRKSGQSGSALRSLWYHYGEDAVVPHSRYSGSSELDFFIDNPASREERDWQSLKP